MRLKRSKARKILIQIFFVEITGKFFLAHGKLMPTRAQLISDLKNARVGGALSKLNKTELSKLHAQHCTNTSAPSKPEVTLAPKQEAKPAVLTGGSYREFVSKNLGKHGGSMSQVAAAWKAQKTGNSTPKPAPQPAAQPAPQPAPAPAPARVQNVAEFVVDKPKTVAAQPADPDEISWWQDPSSDSSGEDMEDNDFTSLMGWPEPEPSDPPTEEEGQDYPSEDESEVFSEPEEPEEEP